MSTYDESATERADQEAIKKQELKAQEDRKREEDMRLEDERRQQERRAQDERKHQERMKQEKEQKEQKSQPNEAHSTPKQGEEKEALRRDPQAERREEGQKPFDQVNADYKYVMRNLEKENDRQQGQTQSPAMQKYLEKQQAMKQEVQERVEKTYNNKTQETGRER